MKTVSLILLVFITLLLTSCGHETPMFDSGKHPFIVTSISRESDSTCVYISNSWNYPGTQFLSDYPEFVAKTGLFKVGDTVQVTIKK